MRVFYLGRGVEANYVVAVPSDGPDATNGAGKTTLLNVMSRVAPIASGELTLLGEPATTLSSVGVAGLGVARTFQLAESFSQLTVEQFMGIGLLNEQGPSSLAFVLGLPAARRQERRNRDIIAAELERYSLEDVPLDVEMGYLSYGVRKRIDLARATVSRPNLLLLDEPTSGLAEPEIEDTAAVIEQVHSAGDITVVLVDHRVDFIRRLCSDVLVMAEGRRLAEGPVDETLGIDVVASAFLGNHARDETV